MAQNPNEHPAQGMQAVASDGPSSRKQPGRLPAGERRTKVISSLKRLLKSGNAHLASPPCTCFHVASSIPGLSLYSQKVESREGEGKEGLLSEPCHFYSGDADAAAATASAYSEAPRHYQRCCHPLPLPPVRRRQRCSAWRRLLLLLQGQILQSRYVV